MQLVVHMHLYWEMWFFSEPALTAWHFSIFQDKRKSLLGKLLLVFCLAFSVENAISLISKWSEKRGVLELLFFNNFKELCQALCLILNFKILLNMLWHNLQYKHGGKQH